MSFSYWSQTYHKISEDDVRKVVPKAFKTLEKTLLNLSPDRTLEETLGKWAYEEYAGEPRNEERLSITEALAKLRSSFYTKTKLHLQYTYVPEGLRGSDVSDESFWYISNAQVDNPKLATAWQKYQISCREVSHVDGG